jgi:hypothetical protein
MYELHNYTCAVPQIVNRSINSGWIGRSLATLPGSPVPLFYLFHVCIYSPVPPRCQTHISRSAGADATLKSPDWARAILGMTTGTHPISPEGNIWNVDGVQGI